ncbi:MAG: sulfite exporter TauE/SafE family protein [Fimbriimonadaceae bacterium]|nr:sulfite exporter TauE/SafE family protein [Fimbriimonadaceae bacterium]
MKDVAVPIVIGLVAGISGGLFGIGGGIIIVPALVAAMGFAQQKAQGTSLFLFTMPVAILGVLEYARRDEVDFPLAGWLALGFVGGSLLGGRLAGQLDSATMQRVFAVFLMAVAVWLFIRAQNG